MFKANLLTAIRHLIKNKGLSAINIFGISVSIAICLLSYLFITFENSHDNFHKDGDRVYQVINKIVNQDNVIDYNTLQNQHLAEDLQRDISNIEHTARFKTCDAWIRHESKKLYETIAFSDSTFFKMFSFDFLVGSKKKALCGENGVIITKELADKMIKTNSLNDYSKLIGKTIEFPNIKNRNLTITGILKDIPNNSSIKFDLIVQYKHSNNYSESNNDIGNTSIYVMLNDAINKDNVEKTASANVKMLYKDLYAYYTKTNNTEDTPKELTIELLNIKDTYFSDKLKWAAYSEIGDKKRSNILSYISILVLILACVNYVMLSVGISMKRFKEIAVKKVFGSKRRSIILQFVTETSATVLISIALGVVLAELSLPYFNELTSAELSFNLYTSSFAYFFLIGLFIVIVSTISIPGVYISKQNPISIFRNQTKMGSRLGVAKSFMVIQFTLSLILIIASVFIIKQINHMKNQDVGYNTENVIVIDLPSDFSYSKKQSLQRRLDDINGVICTSMSDRNFTMGSSSGGIRLDTTSFVTRILQIDTSYLKTLDIKLLMGRNLRNAKPGTKGIDALIVNETFVKRLGLTNPLGEIVSMWNMQIPIVGVIEDFHIDSMHRKIDPLACFNGMWLNYLFIKIKKGKTSHTIKDMKDLWLDFDGERDLKYSFLDDKLQKQYKGEERIAKIVSTITILALMISVFGLVGLTMLLLMQKIKEIGVRKINGASTWQILVLINKEFGKYLLLASLIAIPLSYYGLNKWLEEFAVKTPLNIWVFALCALGLGFIVLLTISYKSARAASSNPVISIRHE